MAPVVTPAPAVEKIEVEQPTVHNVIGTKDIVWNSYYHLRENFIDQASVRAIPEITTPVDTSKTTSIIAGKEVKRIPILDDFAEMVRRDDCDNHTRLEMYISPIGPTSGLEWFEATMLAVMIENGRIGIKEDMFGNRAVYAYRARTGNPFFRIFGGRTSVLIAIAQWFLFAGIVLLIDAFYKSDIGHSAIGSTVSANGWLLGLVSVLFAYSFIHWRFHKRYAFILSRTLVDGWKARNLPHRYDGKWVHARMAAHAINLALSASAVIGLALYVIKEAGWL
jgi:hypothetical protein